MRSESAKARLSDDFVPVHHYVYSHCRKESATVHTAAPEVVVLAVHERREIRACEGVKVIRGNLRNSVAPEERMIEKQTAL
jgi:hypothetical protein